MAPYTCEKGIVVGYCVDDGTERPVDVNSKLPLLQEADLKDKVVLLRVDHNVVKKGKILDQYRIDVTLPTMYNIIERGGRLIIMSHIGRPYDKKTKSINISEEDESVDAVVAYLQRKMRIHLVVPKFRTTEKDGIMDIDTSINWLLKDLRSRKIGGIYLPNTRWFAGEENKGKNLERLVLQLAGLADVFFNDAFGSWQPHASTYHISKCLPSYAGLCMQDELYHIQAILTPSRPFVAIVAGAKYDTKIGPLTKIYNTVDKLVLGGVIYNTYLCAKYGVKIAGVQDSDIELAKELVKKDKEQNKIVEMKAIVESDTLEGKLDGQYRSINVKDFAPGQTYKYTVDVDPISFEYGDVMEALNTAKTIFVNAVMGFMPYFWHGTSKMDEVIDNNHETQKFFGGGDTLQAFKSLHPTLYQAALDNVNYYLFTGGDTVLKIIEEGYALGLETIKSLIHSKRN